MIVLKINGKHCVLTAAENKPIKMYFYECQLAKVKFGKLLCRSVIVGTRSAAWCQQSHHTFDDIQYNNTRIHVISPANNQGLTRVMQIMFVIIIMAGLGSPVFPAAIRSHSHFSGGAVVCVTEQSVCGEQRYFC